MSISIEEGIASQNIFKRVTISGALSHSCKSYSRMNDLAYEFSARPTHHRLPRNLIEHETEVYTRLFAHTFCTYFLICDMCISRIDGAK